MTEWTPFVTDPAERSRLAHLIIDTVAVVAKPEVRGAQRGTDDLCDLAVLRAYVSDIVPEDRDADADTLLAAITQLGTHGGGAALYGGAARIGWTVAHLADGETADRVAESIDASLHCVLEAWGSDYDLTGGLVGLGVYALERGVRARSLALLVLDKLEALARPRGNGLAWFTPPDRLPEWQRAIAPRGYWNVGLAHGSPGVVGLLARYLMADIDPARTARLLRGAVDCLLGAEPAAVSPRFPRWYQEPPGPRNRTRLAWCYGDLGVSIALLAAARATTDAAWYDGALAIARGCATISYEDSLVRDASLCHGAFGAAHIFHRMARATGDATLAAATRTWLDRGVAMLRTEAIADSAALGASGDHLGEESDRSLLGGAIGVALAIHAMIGDVEPLWDRLLLADL